MVRVASLGVKPSIVNANDERWRWQRVKRKTDQDDALKLARLALLDQLPTVHLTDPQQRHPTIDDSSPLDRVAANAVSQRHSLDRFSQQGIALARGQKRSLTEHRATARLRSTHWACSIDELWRGRLNSELQLMASINTQLRQLDNKLDELADPRMKLLQDTQRRRPSHRRSGGALHR